MRNFLKPLGRRQDGFALLITITLLAFLVLLLVSLATLTRVETQVAANSQQLAQARQNALMALNIALGQLQQAAGPDQRVTARADILDPLPVLSTTVVKQPLWTGVWKTGNAGLDAVNSGTPQRQTSLGSLTPTTAQKVSSATWLVSNPTPTTPVDPTSYAGISTGATPNAVDLATKVGPSQNVTVTVPLVDIQAIPAGFTSAQTIGRYGYWVSDEGVKAKVNISDPTAQKTYTGGANLDPVSDLPKNLLHFAAPQSIAAYKILPSTLATDFRAAPNVDQVMTPQQLPYLPTVAPTGYVVNKYAADVTTYGYGVLADVRNGGLKKDLTAAFEDTGNTVGKSYAKLNPDGTARVYRAPVDTVPIILNPAIAPAGTTLALDGLRWINLFTFYNLYKSTFPSLNMGSGGRVTNPRVSVAGSKPSGIGNPAASNRPYSISPRGHAWTDTGLGASNGNFSMGTLAPISLSCRWDVSVASTPTAGGWTLLLNYYPQLTLYNPYAVTISAPLNNFRYGRALAAAGNFYLETTVGSGAAAKVYFTALNQGTTLQRMLFTTGFDDTQTLKPGEIRVFGLKSPIAGTQSSIAIACEMKVTAAPYGYVSNGYAANLSRSAQLEVLTSLGNPAAIPATSDVYGPLPAQTAGTPVSIRLIPAKPNAVNVTSNTAYGSPLNATINRSGSGDYSIPQSLYWPSLNTNGGAVLNSIPTKTGSGGGRYGISGAPGSIGTGFSGSVPGKPALTANIDTLGETQVLSIFVRKKGINLTAGQSYSNASFAVPNFSGNSSIFNPINDCYGASYWDELYIGSNATFWPSYPPSTGQLQSRLTSTGYTTTTWGIASAGALSPPNAFGSRIILADVPVQPMLSLGQFMHLQQFYIYNSGNYTSMGFGSMFVGGSIPSAEIPTTQSALDANSTLFMDHSYLANQALFDSYYFSTVPPSGSAPGGTTWPAQWTSFNAANSGTTLTNPSIPFLNRRLTPIYTNGQAAALADLRDMDKAAANLLLNGAFNVNSTSVDAWRALLSSLSGNDLSLWDATTETAHTFTSNQLLNPISRFWSSNSGILPNSLWSGVRALNDAEITSLATEIVAQVKARGPFLSMADFLNRRLGVNTSYLSRAGALQAAIDHTSLNASIASAGAGTTSIPTSGPNLPPVPPISGNMKDASSSGGAPWSSTIGAPGYLMQQDLVQAFSPVMTARSDTFLIRTYGEVVNPSMATSAGKAWLEAVIQRLPEYINSTADAAEVYPPTNITNQTFGRRFKVISVRWISSNEI